jgi:hypothetical protein
MGIGRHARIDLLRQMTVGGDAGLPEIWRNGGNKMRIEAHPMRYFANIIERGTIRYGQFGCAIGVLDSPDNHTLVGSAFDHARTSSGIAVWRLHVRQAEVPGRWIIVDGAFVQLEEAAVTESSPLPDQFRHLSLL